MEGDPAGGDAQAITAFAINDMAATVPAIALVVFVFIIPLLHIFLFTVCVGIAGG